MKTICLLTYLLSGVLLLAPGKPSPKTLPFLNINLLEADPFLPALPTNLKWTNHEENQGQLLALESRPKTVLQNIIEWFDCKTSCQSMPEIKESSPSIQGRDPKQKRMLPMPLYTSELPS
ncbi:hypothetical protein [Nibribacter koreensis]|uniref:hypothetical protein n=1 Tax=Nibribacter koreensis TaxID=1084519 RepID=UPI0031E8636B